MRIDLSKEYEKTSKQAINGTLQFDLIVIETA
jgi:hypothetical protein